jgi:actin-related protein
MEGDLATAREKPSGRRWYDRDFVLPDYRTSHNGEVRIPPLLQRDLEREAQKKKQGANVVEDEDDDDDEEEDEDFEIDENEQDDDDDDEEDVVMSDGGDEDKKPTKEAKKKKKTNKTDDNEDDDDDDDEEETMEQKRKRILQQRAQEERRRREQEEEEQILRVSVERFAVPEVLFRPLDAGLQPDLVGLAQAIVQSVESCPLPYRPALYQTIYLVGGVSRLPNLKQRLEQELRCLVPSEFKMHVAVADSPIDRSWLGAKALFATDSYSKWSVSQQEWIAAGRRRGYTKLFQSNGGCYV